MGSVASIYSNKLELMQQKDSAQSGGQMNSKRKLLLVCSVIFMRVGNYSCSVQSKAVASPSPGAPAEIAAQSAANGTAFQYLREVTDEIGPRLTGTAQAKMASIWAMEKMSAIGLENVHLEHWQIPRGWERGHARAELTLPLQRAVAVTSLGWAGSTPAGGSEGPVITVARSSPMNELRNSAPSWTGKVLFLISDQTTRKDVVKEFAELAPIVSLASSSGALAVVVGDENPEFAGMALAHTGPVSFSGEFYPIPVVDMNAEDRLQVLRFLNAGREVRIKLDVENHTTSGPVDCTNVVGERRGSEHPEEIIVAAAHLDSWDLSPGAVDDGVGVAAVLEAAKAITSRGTRPQRTIRFVLFTGEEQGLLGSRAYVREHEKELQKHVAAIVLDDGQGPITQIHLAGHDSLLPPFRSFVKESKILTSVKVDSSFALFTDGYSFTLAGLPGISFGQNSPGYAKLHHSNADTLDKVDANILARNSDILGLTCFWMADRPGRAERIWSKEKTARILSERKQSRILTMLGMGL